MFAKELNDILSENGQDHQISTMFVAETQTYELMVKQDHMLISRRSGRMRGPCHIHPNVKWSAWKWEDNGMVLLPRSAAST